MIDISYHDYFTSCRDSPSNTFECFGVDWTTGLVVNYTQVK